MTDEQIKELVDHVAQSDCVKKATATLTEDERQQFAKDVTNLIEVKVKQMFESKKLLIMPGSDKTVGFVMSSSERFDHLIELRSQYESKVDVFISSHSDDQITDLIRESREGGHGPLGYYIAERLEQVLGTRKLIQELANKQSQEDRTWRD